MRPCAGKMSQTCPALAAVRCVTPAKRLGPGERYSQLKGDRCGERPVDHGVGPELGDTDNVAWALDRGEGARVRAEGHAPPHRQPGHQGGGRRPEAPAALPGHADVEGVLVPVPGRAGAALAQGELPDDYLLLPTEDSREHGGRLQVPLEQASQGGALRHLHEYTPCCPTALL